MLNLIWPGQSSGSQGPAEALAVQYKGQVVFVTSRHGSESSQPIIKYFGADPGRKDPQVSSCCAGCLSLQQGRLLWMQAAVKNYLHCP